MNKFLSIPIILLSVLLCLSCSQERFLLISHEAFRQVLGPDTGFYTSAAKAAASAGFAFDLKMIDDYSDTGLMDAPAKSRAKVVLLDPLVSLARADYPGAYPQVFFIAYVPAPAEHPPVNVLFVEFDRGDAYGKAGEAAGILLDEPFVRKDLKEKPKLGAIIFSPDEDSKAELSQFNNGFSRTGDPGNLTVKDLPDLVDQNNAQTTYRTLREAGARLFLLRAYTLNAFLLDILNQYKDFGIIATSLDTQIYPQCVLFSIIDDYDASFRASLAVARQNDGKNAEWGTGKIGVKARLIWNPGIAMPEKLKKMFPVD
jgi:hypothetical protein